MKNYVIAIMIVFLGHAHKATATDHPLLPLKNKQTADAYMQSELLAAIKTGKGVRGSFSDYHASIYYSLADQLKRANAWDRIPEEKRTKSELLNRFCAHAYLSGEQYFSPGDVRIVGVDDNNKHHVLNPPRKNYVGEKFLMGNAEAMYPEYIQGHLPLAATSNKCGNPVNPENVAVLPEPVTPPIKEEEHETASSTDVSADGKAEADAEAKADATATVNINQTQSEPAEPYYVPVPYYIPVSQPMPMSIPMGGGCNNGGGFGFSASAGISVGFGHANLWSDVGFGGGGGNFCGPQQQPVVINNITNIDSHDDNSTTFIDNSLTDNSINNSFNTDDHHINIDDHSTHITHNHNPNPNPNPTDTTSGSPTDFPNGRMANGNNTGGKKQDQTLADAKGKKNGTESVRGSGDQSGIANGKGVRTEEKGDEARNRNADTHKNLFENQTPTSGVENVSRMNRLEDRKNNPSEQIRQEKITPPSRNDLFASNNTANNGTVFGGSNEVQPREERNRTNNPTMNWQRTNSNSDEANTLTATNTANLTALQATRMQNNPWGERTATDRSNTNQNPNNSFGRDRNNQYQNSDANSNNTPRSNRQDEDRKYNANENNYQNQNQNGYDRPKSNVVPREYKQRDTVQPERYQKSRNNNVRAERPNVKQKQQPRQPRVNQNMNHGGGGDRHARRK